MLRLSFCNTVPTDVLRFLEQYRLFHNVKQSVLLFCTILEYYYITYHDTIGL